MAISTAQLLAFIGEVWAYYDKNARSGLPWRRPDADGSFDPYKILVSELMLQQTQVTRVIPKYEAFLARFGAADVLAAAELGDVLRAWQGLGYNRRAKYLWQAAKQIVAHGWPADLTDLPGVGVNTAGAIRAYAFNEPVVFIETNIRTVYIHHFAADQQDVPDTFIRELLRQTLELVGAEEKERPKRKSHFSPGTVTKNAVLSHESRDFYWALMDYGSFLKTSVRNISQSKHYKRQSTFHGSRRQLRGLVIRELSKHSLNLEQFTTQSSDERLGLVLSELENEGLIVKHGAMYYLSP